MRQHVPPPVQVSSDLESATKCQQHGTLPQNRSVLEVCLHGGAGVGHSLPNPQAENVLKENLGKSIHKDHSEFSVFTGN